MGLKLTDRQTVFLDTAPLIYYFEENERYIDRMAQFIEQVFQLDVQMATYIEILTFPTENKMETLAAKYRDFLTNSENLSLYPLNPQIADSAIQMRVKYRLKTPDAIQLATAKVCGADHVLTNDREWGSHKGSPNFPRKRSLNRIENNSRIN